MAQSTWCPNLLIGGCPRSAAYFRRPKMDFRGIEGNEPSNLSQPDVSVNRVTWGETLTWVRLPPCDFGKRLFGILVQCFRIYASLSVTGLVFVPFYSIYSISVPASHLILIT